MSPLQVKPMTIRTPALVLTILLAAMPALAGQPDACETAKHRLRNALDDSRQEITHPVALALADAVEACPPVDPREGMTALDEASGMTFQIVTDGIVTVVTLLADGSPPPPRDVSPGPFSRDCGFAADQSFQDSRAIITMWRQIGPDSTPDHDEGRSDVTYSVGEELTVWDGGGVKYRIHARGDGSDGAVWIYGVEVKARRSSASSGCLAHGGDACWGTGTATVTVERAINIFFVGQSNVCAR